MIDDNGIFRPTRRQRAEMRMDGLLKVIQDTQAQLQQTQEQLQQLVQIVAQSGQQINGALRAVVQAVSAPRRRVPIRDQDGRITEAHDIPMGMQ